MKIKIINLIPKDWIIKDLGNKINVTYLTKKGNYNRKAFILPKEVKIDKEFIEGVGLFLGDSDLNRKEKNHLGYCSIDKDIAKHALNFLQKYFLIRIDDITFSLQYKKFNGKVKTEWSNYLKIPKEKILIRQSNRHNNEAFSIQVNGTVFRRLFELVIKYILSKNILTNKILRRALLRGLFAAEGNVGVDYLEKKPYISQITFSLNIKEGHIESLICKSLEIEKINYRINKGEKDHSLNIVVTNWNNYWKLWKMNLFDICKRKKIKFLGIMKNLKIYCIMNNKTRKKFFGSINLMQKEIANLVGSWQGNVSKTIKGIHLLTIERIMILQKLNNLPTKEIKDGIKILRIGSLTKIKEKKFKDFIWNLKATNY